MKKFIVYLFLITRPFISLGQNITTNDSNLIGNENNGNLINETESQYELATENLSEKFNNEGIETEYGMGDFIFGFCNEGDDNLSQSLNYAISQGKPFDICLLFYNPTPVDLTIQTRIVDQDVTAQGDLTCDYTSTGIQQFIDQKYLSELYEITLPAGQYIKKTFQVLFPIGVEGDMESCFTYHMKKEGSDSENGGAGFSVIVNNGYYMNFFVGDLSSIQNKLLFENLLAQKDDNGELNLQFNLINTGNLEDKVSIKGTITNIFGFHKEFTINGSGIQVKPGDTVPVSAVLGSLPSYGGLYKIEFTATATPFFSYDISNSTIDPTLLEPKEFTASTTFFQMPWLIIIIAIVVILLIISMFRKPKEKVVYVNNPQQPMPNNGYGYQQPQQYQQPVQAQQPTQNQQ